MEQDLATDFQLIAHISFIPTILNVLCQTTGAGFASVNRVTAHRWISCSAIDKIGFGLKAGDEIPIQETLCNSVRESAASIIFDDVANDKVYKNHPIPAARKFQSHISVPIIRKNGDFFGTICALDKQPREFNNPAVINLFNSYADLIALQVDSEEEKMTYESLLSAERMRYEQVLKNETKLKILIEASDLGYWEIQVKERIVEFSDRFMAISGIKAHVIMTIDEIFSNTHPEDLQARLDAYNTALTTGEFYFKGRIIWPDKSIHWIESKGKTFFENNEPSYILGVTRDITPEKNADDSVE